MPQELSGARVAVIGLAGTGLAVAEVLTALGAEVIIYDRKSEVDLGEAVVRVRSLGAAVVAGTDDVDTSGIDLLVPSPGVPANAPSIVRALESGVEVISEIELAYQLARAPIVAVTGTNGKTTTTILIGRIFQAAGREVHIAGNVAAGDIKKPLVRAAFEASDSAVIAAEVSTFQLEWIKHFRPRVAVLTNVTSDHLDRHGSIEEYARLKARIFENQTADDWAVVNAENSISADLVPRLSAKVLTFARRSPVAEGAFVSGQDLVVRLNGVERIVCSRSDIPLRGEHNVENILAAACAASAMGCEPESIRSAVRAFRPVEHRLEPVAVVDGVEYINNSMCTNVDAAVRSIEAIEQPQIVIAGGRDKGSDFTPLGEAFKRRVKHAVLIGADADRIEEAARRAGFEAVSKAGSLREAVDIARSLAVPGDVVVLTPACASFDMFDSFEHRGLVFKQIVDDIARGGHKGCCG